MARLVLKCRYLKSGSAKHAGNHVKYIATRDGVEKLDDSWKSLPATKAQKKLIDELISDFPDSSNSFEYQDYLSTPTRGTASEFITQTLENNIDLIDKRENYVGYIAMRPHVEKSGTHGLFTDSDVPINLSAVAREVSEHEGNVWTNILSIRREDAVRLGFDKGSSWRDLLRGQTETMATAMKIPLTDLKWYAAFHDEGNHPHVHIVMYSKDKEPYLSKQGIRKMRASFAHEIFKQDLMQVYEQQTEHRNALARESRDVISEIMEQINSGDYRNETVELMLKELSQCLSNTKGKKEYGYLSHKAKNLVNGIVDELAKDSRIAALYDLWYEQRGEILKIYSDNTPERIPLSQNNEFRSVRNAVVQEAMNIADNRFTFEETFTEQDETAPDIPDERIEPIEDVNPWNNPSDMHYQYRKAKQFLKKDSEKYDPVEAVRWLRLSAEQGYDIAMYRLGKMFLHGDEIDKDVSYGLHWLWQAESRNNQYAQYLLGKTYLKGEDVYADFSEAEDLFESASRQGNSFAKYSLAKMHLDGLARQSSTGKALSLLRESADLGNQYAQYLLGKILMRGELTKKDTTSAENLLTSAAEQKNGQAMYLLGKLYLSDDGIPKNAGKAIRWLWDAVEQDNQYAKYQLGKMYLYGQKVERDYNLAVRLLTASADQGNAYAERVLENYHFTSDNSSVALASMRLIAYMLQIFRDNMRNDGNNRMFIEKKLRQKIAEKMELHGQKMG